MPVIHINCKADKTDAEKRAVYKGITDVCVKQLGCAPEVVEIFWHDITDNNFARAGEMLADTLKKKGK
ncbi:MAG: tautomerase family protein [Alphaproteobacteria bacterium]